MSLSVGVHTYVCQLCMRDVYLFGCKCASVSVDMVVVGVIVDVLREVVSLRIYSISNKFDSRSICMYLSEYTVAMFAYQALKVCAWGGGCEGENVL